MKSITNISGQALHLIIDGKTVTIQPREELVVSKLTEQIKNMASGNKKMLRISN